MVHPTISRRGCVHAGATLGALIALPALMRHAPAQATALAPMLRILCRAPAGSIPDTVARRYANQFSGRIAMRVPVDNRTGAAGYPPCG